MSPRLLISVRDVIEARVALAAGADLIDLKEPDAGALGAVDSRVARDIVKAIAGCRTTSATVGDLPADAAILAQAARRTASTGVDYVKIGFMPAPRADVCGVICALAPVAVKVPLIAVLFADAMPEGDAVTAASSAGFAGVMLDTAVKGVGRLLDHVDVFGLGEFIASAKGNGLICGLAGSLRREDTSHLATLAPDYLGFRGAACIESRRGGELDAGRVALLRQTLDGTAARPARVGALVPAG